MQFVLRAFDGVGSFFSEVSDRIELLLDEKNKIRFLWLLTGVLFVFGVADNRTAVAKIWEATTAQNIQFEETGELVKQSLNTVILWVASLALTVFFWVCEANLILGWREPEEAHARFQEANQFRLDAASSNAPDAAGFYYNALMSGELFDIRVAKVVGVVAFLFDIAIQWQNRIWGGSNVDIMISAVHALLMLVGTELLMVLIRVVRRRSYPSKATTKATTKAAPQPQSDTASQKPKAKSQSQSQWQVFEKDGQTYYYNASTGTIVDSQGNAVR
jgi:hypothetical protein